MKVPQSGQNHTAKRSAPGRSKRLTCSLPAVQRNCVSGTKALAACALAPGDGVLPGTAVSSPQPLGTEIGGQVGFSPDGKHVVVIGGGIEDCGAPLLDSIKMPFLVNGFMITL